ncbi:phosphoribosylformylglycinamidine synthase II [candidate division WOR-1 bacterium RIFOXYA12_FULL_43_27]|uniref:Phosphoribosylformylglycinamidine synthase subunit PurL n=1 Tax=candidate division WOR-1 bacterium RIFOXYC2_FULL_46_14 TaxID=1802587 RepID=A0A1F4U698_UNCSA|nr:MAG: phosphoribosylformylglycinamidine synthase II [candidate division WOR-1 bacterium RIFOXYA12_FULL_43_27]OGC20566.1 MAG: phosphoribosylformylglycinamidine synthase II [candidate division WOR-1 bacterium RIFOXYB2_FULL_46_45]OGC31697.1 MAG: phosphoribosylformylglycinamidine synthase II [candidate division WOR-1 bacterium RIFOXYA2_FULL_46_56]OGC40407.1 MAG: phosphoribosylformylglycinamidine synthase II [candidate division WOR-1 bacterium RIFOXYC2_FULL_46_14]
MVLTKDAYRELGLTDQEYKNILKILKRNPTPTELAMFSVEWSEHCGYPRSRKYLKLFPQTGKYETLVGEDSGGIIYDGMAIVFKMESHNHPSQVEPRQGAATGIGGIVRDIFTAGTRPIACLDSLRFGELSDPYNKFLLNGVVSGISFYGNCIGVPTIGGEIYFNDCYSGNCLVNAMCIGIAPREKLARGKAVGIGNTILYAGAKTGRDGIGGCSVLASSEFKEGEEEKRPTVQVGDPFLEKCLIEATLEALDTGVVLGIKDMGAAGLTCSTAEMAAAGEVGMHVDLDEVPLREEGMEPYEIMMSESQERMLLCVKKGKEKIIQKIYKKWGLEAVKMGVVVKEKTLKINYKGKKVCQVPTFAMAEAPVYDMPYLKVQSANIKVQSIKQPKDFNKTLIQLLSSPNIASKKAVFEQYDHMVQLNTVVLPGGDAAVIRVKDKKWGIAATTDCNSRYCFLNPYKGAQIAVAEACRNLVVTGADPAAVTDCLNFGNPEKPDRYYYFKRSVEGIADICRAWELPVVSGNVSFYNESPKGAIYPTPGIGMIGIIKDVEKRCTADFKDDGDLVVLLGENKEELGGSEYLKVVHGKEEGPPPELDLRIERRVQKACLEGIEVGVIKSAHDLAEGGLAVALAESSLFGGKGVMVSLTDRIRLDALLFGESQSRIIITIAPESIFSLQDILMINRTPFQIIGKVKGKKVTIHYGEKKIIDLSLTKLREKWTLQL